MTAPASGSLIPLNAECKAPIDGVQRGGKIVGGQTAKNGEWDWIVQFPSVGCGGSVIAKNWVITAAHCCKGRKLQQMMTNFGDHDIKTNTDKNFMLRPIQMVVHPGWHPSTFNNDVCLLKYETIPYNDRVAPVCIPSKSDPDPKPGSVCFVAGWGLIKPRVKISYFFGKVLAKTRKINVKN